ncbi:MAG: hypothetical protein AAGG68_30955 [Bacteroidota bacterium]
MIAGTFRSTNNAQDRLLDIKDMGFYNAEVIQFDYPDGRSLQLRSNIGLSN